MAQTCTNPPIGAFALVGTPAKGPIILPVGASGWPTEPFPPSTPDLTKKPSRSFLSSPMAWPDGWVWWRQKKLPWSFVMFPGGPGGFRWLCLGFLCITVFYS